MFTTALGNEKQYGQTLQKNTSPYFHSVSLVIWPLSNEPIFRCEMIILRNKSHGDIIRVCLGIFTTALRNEKKIWSNSPKKYLTLLQQCSACYLPAYYVKKNPF